MLFAATVDILKLCDSHESHQLHKLKCIKECISRPVTNINLKNFLWNLQLFVPSLYYT